VHHIKPFHIEPELELEPDNLITLCMDEFDCHLLIGHGDSFQCYNPHVVEDCSAFRKANIEERTAIATAAKNNRLKD